MSTKLEWLATDYHSRTVKEILARGGGNCFEMASVYMSFVKTLNIRYHPIAETNVHRYSESRQQRAEERVLQKGNRMSVFGLQHNDHRWVEVYNPEIKEWEPVDPTMNIFGTQQWLKARLWFGDRVTPDTNVSNDMLFRFAIFISGATMESRAEHYLVHKFNKLYDFKLSGLKSWNKRVQQIGASQTICRDAFRRELNLHRTVRPSKNWKTRITN